MKYLDEFRDSQAVERLLDQIRRRASRKWTIMEVCGGQTHGLLRYGFDEELEEVVELLHGPGCPVCVTSAQSIDTAIQLARRPQVLLASFGDMLRVPGSESSLAHAKATGAQVRVVYSPLDAVALAQNHPEMTVVFFAVGFETTAPATALAVLHADRLRLSNFYLLTAHVRVEPAMEMLLAQDGSRIAGFLAAGHVCTITGTRWYDNLCSQYRVPVVVTGFEPLDLATGLLACVEQLERRTFFVENRYQRSVCRDGNQHALRIINEVYESCDRQWRGLGVVPSGGLQLRGKWAQFEIGRTDRFQELQQQLLSGDHHCDRCRSGDVLTGRLKPNACPEFATNCTPQNPLGAPMVSSEGACAAYFHAGKVGKT